MKNANELTSLSLERAASLLSRGEISSRELTEAYVQRTETEDNGVGAYITFCAKAAIEQADSADRAIKAGSAFPLTGIPYALKDNICTRGVRTTCASKMLEGFIPPYDATVSQILNEQNAVLLGKTNMDEFSMGSSTENSALKRTVNPINEFHVPGGSSGGSAAAVAAREASFALGSDTGGSVRLPSSFCGVVGMMPTYGTVSRYGLIAFASSLDRIGPITRSVRDNACVLSELCVKDMRDSTSVGISDRELLRGADNGVKGMHLAIPTELFGDDISSDVRAAVENAARIYEKCGASVDLISVPSVSLALSAYYIISSAEASSNLARYDGVRYGYRSECGESLDAVYKNTRSYALGDEVKRRIMLGTHVLSSGYRDEYYKKALSAKAEVRADFDLLFTKYDALLSPVYPTSAPLLGTLEEDRKQQYRNDALTVPASIAGTPALSLPCGKDKSGLPIGLQIMGGAFSERKLYRIGYTLECETKGGRT